MVKNVFKFLFVFVIFFSLVNASLAYNVKNDMNFPIKYFEIDNIAHPNDIGTNQGTINSNSDLNLLGNFFLF